MIYHLISKNCILKKKLINIIKKLKISMKIMGYIFIDFGKIYYHLSFYRNGSKVRVVVFNATFNNISVISWRSV
jgi:hypothetical protein